MIETGKLYSWLQDGKTGRALTGRAVSIGTAAGRTFVVLEVTSYERGIDRKQVGSMRSVRAELLQPA